MVLFWGQFCVTRWSRVQFLVVSAAIFHFRQIWATGSQIYSLMQDLILTSSHYSGCGDADKTQCPKGLSLLTAKSSYHCNQLSPDDCLEPLLCLCQIKFQCLYFLSPIKQMWINHSVYRTQFRIRQINKQQALASRVIPHQCRDYDKDSLRCFPWELLILLSRLDPPFKQKYSLII